MSPDIFVSYSRKDSNAVSNLCAFLRDKGYSVWLDQTKMEVGDPWPAEIEKGINGCRVFVVVLSCNSCVSREVEKEVCLASEDRKVILPISLPPPCKLTGGIRYHLAGLQQLTVNPPSGLEALGDKLCDTIAQLGDESSIDIASFTRALPVTDCGAFPIHTTVDAILRTLVKEVPRHLVDQLVVAQEKYYLSSDEPEYFENGLRRLRNHGLLQHDGPWLFTPTRSTRVWATAWGELLIEVLSTERQTPPRLQRLAYAAVEQLSTIESNPGAVMELKAIATGKCRGLTDYFRILRNLSLISYHDLSSKAPLLHELSASDFSVTDLGRYVLERLNP